MIRFFIMNGKNSTRFDMPTDELFDHLGSIGIREDIPITCREKIYLDFYPTDDKDEIADIVCKRLLIYGGTFMRNFFKNVKAKVIGAAASVKRKACCFAAKVRDMLCMRALQTRAILAESRGENFVDSGIKILIAVVIGALLLGGLYALFGDTIMPTVTEKVEEMFEFNG